MSTLFTGKRLLRTGALLAALLTGVAALVPFAQGPARAEPRAELRAEPRAVTPRGPLLPFERNLVETFQKTAPSVAYITTERLRAAGVFAREVAVGAGSGFVWDARGHVVTNHHVVAGARRVFVRLDEGEPIEAVPVGFAPHYDLAVVRLVRPPRGLRPIPIGTSADLQIGQVVLAIGNPFGLERTLTQGIISALDRDLPITAFREVWGVIQTDAAINPGNSGGPLVDTAGRLIGVNTAIRAPAGAWVGLGFAIPVDLVNRIVPSLIERGRAPLPGVGIDPFPPEVVALAGIRGVVIRRVTPGLPAAMAGLRPADPRTGDLGDVIVAVDGRRVDTVARFSAELDRVGVNNLAELTVVRGRVERRVRVRVVDLNP
jgi:2-alkenal reductase